MIAILKQRTNRIRRFLFLIGCLVLQVGVPLLTAAEERTFYLAVEVISKETGDPISGARVNVYEGLWSSLVVAPPAYHDDTNNKGVARIELKATKGKNLKVSLEISREDMQTETRVLNLKPNFPDRLPLEKISLKNKTTLGGEDVISVAINVQEGESRPIKDATVLIYDSTLGNASGRFVKATSSDGIAIVPVTYASADPTELVQIIVSKKGYEEKKKFMELERKDVGKSVLGGTVTLQRSVKDAEEVTISVVDKKDGRAVTDAKVILDGPGYYSEKASDGTAILAVAEMGSFAVRISQDTYRPLTDSIELVKGGERSFTFKLERKLNKEEGRDRIEATVLGKATADGQSQPVPISGAMVRAGTVSAATDSNGMAELTGGFDDAQEVTVSAANHKSQNATIRLARSTPFSAGTGKKTFVLEPELSENNAIRVVVDVTDENGKKIRNAKAVFSLTDGTVLSSGSGEAGTIIFSSSDAPGKSLAEMRNGINIKVTATGYQEVDSLVHPDLLKPSLSAVPFSVTLNKNWNELTAAIAALEAKVQAWNADRNKIPSGNVTATMIDKMLLARKEAERLVKEIAFAKDALHFNVAPGIPTWCSKAEALQKEIRAAEVEANQKGAELKQLIALATNIAEHCTGKADAEKVRAHYNAAIKLLGPIGSAEKKAVKVRDELMAMAKEASVMEKLLTELDGKAAAIDAQIQIADEVYQNAAKLFLDADGQRSIVTRLIGLKAELAVLTVKYPEEIPVVLQTRIDAIEGILSTSNVVNITGPAKSIPESIRSGPQYVKSLKSDADKMIQTYRDHLCTIDTLEAEVSGLHSVVSDAGLEIGLGADLLTKADECEAAHPDSTPTPIDEVVVPDFSGLNSVAAIKGAASGAGVVAVLAATNATSTGTQLVASQEFPAGTKVPRGKDVKIFLYQSIAAPTPSPTPTPAVSPVNPDEVIVPDVTVFDNVAQMKAALAQVGLSGTFGSKGKPPSEDLEFKVFQAPAPNAKVKRGTPVVVSIYQKFEDPTAAASPTPLTPTAPALGVAGAPGNMPNLIGLTIEQANDIVLKFGRIGSDEIGDKPPSPERALTIFAQNPPAGSKISGKTLVSIKRYGSAKGESSDPSGDFFVGTWDPVGGSEAQGGIPVMEISRSGNGLVMNSTEGGKTKTLQNGRVQNGVLSFRGEREIWTFTPVGDKLKVGFQWFDEDGKTPLANFTFSYVRK